MCSLRFENIFFLYIMCSLRFENNVLTVGGVRFALKSSFLSIERVRFASQITFVISNVFASLRKQFANQRRCSLRFDIEENTIIEAFVRFRFASVAITSPYVPLKMLRQNATFLNPVLEGTGTSYFSRLYKRRFNQSFNFNSLLQLFLC